MTANVRIDGASLLATEMGQAAVLAPLKARAIVRKYGALLETRIKAKASGRPGPNAPTGDYRGSWYTEFFSGPGVEGSNTGTNASQGRRLENGFVGQDSLGRTYNQPPFPHVGPAVQEIEPLFVGEMGKVADL